QFGQLPIVIFDYHYITGSGEDETTHKRSASLATLGIDCPYLIIRPETILDRFAASIGFDDINFESDEFNRAFNVRGEDKKFAYDICHAGMMEFLLQERSLTWELHANKLLLYNDHRQALDERSIQHCLRVAEGFVARIPSYL